MNAHIECVDVAAPLKRLIQEALEPHFGGAGRAEIYLSWTGSAITIGKCVEFPMAVRTGPGDAVVEPADCRAKVRRALRIAAVPLAEEV